MLTGSPSGLATIRTQWDASEVEGQRILSRAGRDSNAGGRLLDVEVLNLERQLSAMSSAVARRVANSPSAWPPIASAIALRPRSG
ncbi:hypothetical protein SBBP2_610003 [Burkholderiales bacterium]|nr:hypothetical protein SBBP2_610003 [Burkholderiales bacterium]